MPDVKWYSGGSSATFSTTITPAADDGAALGTTALEWSDLFLASGGVINWGAGNMTITHSAAALTIAGGPLVIPAGSAAAPSLQPPTSNGNLRVGTTAAGSTIFAYSGVDRYGFDVTTAQEFQIVSTGRIGISSGAVGAATDVTISRSAAGVFQIGTSGNTNLGSLTYTNVLAASGYLEIMEQSVPANGEKASCRLYVNSAAGKRQLYARFGTGSGILVAAEL